MVKYELSDFGGRFLTTSFVAIDGRTYPGVSAYVEWFIPSVPKKTSVTFVHGGGGQGSEFLRTPDNRPGWVHSFLRAGYAVYVLDRPGHGRNQWNVEVLGTALSPPAYETLVPRFVEPAKHMLWQEAGKHNQWPVGVPGTVDRFMASQGPMAATLESSQRHVEAIAPELFQLVGNTVLISHSAGGPCGWALSAVGGEQVKAIVAVEPLGAPDLEHPLGCFNSGLCAAPFAGPSNPYSPPIAMLTSEATWMRDMNFRAVEYLKSRGASVTVLDLPQFGIGGNGHMMMSERNSDLIAGVIIDWLGRTI
jgi:pimeloyl-ACP methyl ester carboxylesterase